jgi:hypothetical protein
MSSDVWYVYSLFCLIRSGKETSVWERKGKEVGSSVKTDKAETDERTRSSY